MLKFISYGLSDIGLVRSNNEDVWTALPDIGFFALADGMGGHQAGEIAAKEAIENLSHLIRQNSSSDKSLKGIAKDLREAIESANRWVYQMSKKSNVLAGMGTTLCCLYWTPEAVVYAHIGDSRIYRLREGQLDLLTRDHSLFPKGKTESHYKNVITRAIGTHPKANPEIAISPYEPGDLFFLCSDGLSDVLTDDDMKKILHRSEDLGTAAKRLIEKAKIKGSHDNITVLMIQCEDHGPDLPR